MIKANNFDDKGFTLNSTMGIINALNAQVLGVDTLHPEVAQVIKGSSALASTSKLVANLYANPPASGVQYFAYEIHKFNPVQPAYAQNIGGIGYSALQPVQALWTVFRNASYVGFIIVFIIIGFMVMFRAHISSQAVATVQDSIPRIVIALVLVTFSYAIAGFMIDIMFILINLVINLLAQTGVINAGDASTAIFGHSIFHVFLSSWTDIFGTAAGAVNSILDSIIDLGPINDLLKIGIGPISGLIIGIAALFIMFRIFIMLLMAYVMIILLTLAAPFFFLIQALPGNNGAKDWFKQMASNIAVFPVVSLMIILVGVITGIGNFGGTGGGELNNCAAGAAQQIGQLGCSGLKFPLLVGGFSANAIGKIIGLGILFMVPQATELVKGALGVKGGPNLGGGIMAGVAAGAGAARGFAGEVAPHVPGVGLGLDYMAARRNEPKYRREAIESERLFGDQGQYEAIPGTTRFGRKGR